MYSGMARWASLIKERRREHPAILLDAGGFTDPAPREEAELDDDYFFEGMRSIGYEAAGVGPSEIEYGRTRLLERVDEAGFELLSTNIVDKRGGGRLGSPWTVLRVGGRKSIFGRTGGLRIGVFAVVLPRLVEEIDPLIPRYYDLIDPRLAALEAVSALREKNCDLIVALSYQGWGESLELAREVPGIDLVINGKRGHGSATGEMADGTMVVDTGMKRASFTEIAVEWRGGEPSFDVREVGGRARSMPDDPELEKLEREYQEIKESRDIESRRERDQ